MRHGRLFAAVDGTRQVNHGYHGRYREVTAEEILSFHADPDCPNAAGKPRGDGVPERYDFWRVLDIVLGRDHDGNDPSPLCRTCIWLEPARAEVMADAA